MSNESDEKEPAIESKSSKPKKAKGGGCFKSFALIIFFLVAAVVICFLGFCYISGKEISGTVTELIDKYRPQKVTQEFREYRDVYVKGNEGNILEVATGEQDIILSKEDIITVLGKVVPGVKTTSRINVPATFRYHIDLNEEWKIVADGNRLHVSAPALKPSLPVAFDTAKMQKQNPGWTRYITGDNMDDLEKTITPELETKAKDPEHIKKFQAKAKDSIAKFLQTWLVQDGQWAEGKIEQIIVYFPGDEIDTDDKLIHPDRSIEQPIY